MTNQQGRANRNEPTIWNTLMDRALVNAFVHQQDIGNRVNGNFTSTALDNIVKEISEQFPSAKFDKERVKNRMKYIKRGFGACYDIFKDGLSGFSWNPNTSMWGAEPEVWDTLVQAHPHAATWRNKPIHNYDNLKLLFGADRATLDDAETAREMRERIRNEQEENHADTIEEIDHMVINDEVRLEGYDTPTDVDTPLQNQAEGRRRAKRKVSMEEDVTCVKKSFQVAANAIAKAAADIVKSQEKNQVSESEVPTSEIWKLLEELDLDRVTMHKAYIFLINEPKMLAGILSCPSTERRDILFEMMK